MIPAKFIDALKLPSNYGRSVEEVSLIEGIKLKNTPQETRTRKIDPKSRELLNAVMCGLLDIFNADRKELNNPDRIHPLKKDYEK